MFARPAIYLEIKQKQKQKEKEEKKKKKGKTKNANSNNNDNDNEQLKSHREGVFSPRQKHYKLFRQLPLTSYIPQKPLLNYDLASDDANSTSNTNNGSINFIDMDSTATRAKLFLNLDGNERESGNSALQTPHSRHSKNVSNIQAIFGDHHMSNSSNTNHDHSTDHNSTKVSNRNRPQTAFSPTRNTSTSTSVSASHNRTNSLYAPIPIKSFTIDGALHKHNNSVASDQDDPILSFLCKSSHHTNNNILSPRRDSNTECKENSFVHSNTIYTPSTARNNIIDRIDADTNAAQLSSVRPHTANPNLLNFNSAFLSLHHRRNCLEQDKLILKNRIQLLTEKENKAQKMIDSTLKQLEEHKHKRIQFQQYNTQKHILNDDTYTRRQQQAETARKQRAERMQIVREYHNEQQRRKNEAIKRSKNEHENRLKQREYAEYCELMRKEEKRKAMIEEQNSFRQYKMSQYQYESDNAKRRNQLKLQYEQQKTAEIENEIRELQLQEREILDKVRLTAQTQKETLEMLSQSVQ